MMWTFLIALAISLAPETPTLVPTTSGSVAITLLDERGAPLANQTVDLRVLSLREDELVEKRLVGSCRTDAAGHCSIAIAGADTTEAGIQGFLYVGDATRAIVWGGGTLEVTLRLTPYGDLEGPKEGVFDGVEASATETPMPPFEARPVTVVESERLGAGLTWPLLALVFIAGAGTVVWLWPAHERESEDGTR